MKIFSLPIIESTFTHETLDFLDPIFLSIFGFMPMWFWILKPIKEQKNTAVNKLNESARYITLGEMAGAISHEINNPISIIIGKSEMVIRKINSKTADDEMILNSMKSIHKHSEHVITIIQSLKSLYRDGDKDPFEWASINKIFETAKELCEYKLKSKSVMFSSNIINQDYQILAREVQIVQVLVNLINNSIDAIENKKDKWIKLNFDLNNESGLITVQDSGDGIPESIASHMMETAFTTKGAGKGTGIGLSLSKKIIEDHDGEFYLDRNEKHTTFILKFPKNKFILKIHNEDASLRSKFKIMK